MFKNGIHGKVPHLKKKNLTGTPMLEICPEWIRYETFYKPGITYYPLFLEIRTDPSGRMRKKYRMELNKKDRIFTATFSPQEMEGSTQALKRYGFRPRDYAIENYDRKSGKRSPLFIAKEKTISEIVGDAEKFARKDPADLKKTFSVYSKYKIRLLENVDNTRANLVLVLNDFRDFIRKDENRKMLEQMSSMYFMPGPGETDLPDFGEERKISSYYEDELRYILDPDQRVSFSPSKF